MRQSELDELFRGDPSAIHGALEYYGILPRVADADRRPAEPLRDALAGAVANLDPQHPHAANATMYASFPSGLHPAFNPPELLIWGAGTNASHLFLYFMGLAAQPHVASIDIQVWVNSTVNITASNSAGLTVSSGATSTPVAFAIPFTPTADGVGVVFLEPGNRSQGFSWFGTTVAPA